MWSLILRFLCASWANLCTSAFVVAVGIIVWNTSLLLSIILKTRNHQIYGRWRDFIQAETRSKELLELQEWFVRKVQQSAFTLTRPNKSNSACFKCIHWVVAQTIPHVLNISLKVTGRHGKGLSQLMANHRQKSCQNRCSTGAQNATCGYYIKLITKSRLLSPTCHPKRISGIQQCPSILSIDNNNSVV